MSKPTIARATTEALLRRVDEAISEAAQLTCAVRVQRALESAAPGLNGFSVQTWMLDLLVETGHLPSSGDRGAFYRFAEPLRHRDCHCEDAHIPRDSMGSLLTVKVPHSALQCLYSYEAVEDEVYRRETLRGRFTERYARQPSVAACDR